MTGFLPAELHAFMSSKQMDLSKQQLASELTDQQVSLLPVIELL